jgi:hypothetical protein
MACSSTGDRAQPSASARPTAASTSSPTPASSDVLEPEHVSTECSKAAADMVTGTAQFKRRADGKTDVILDLAAPPGPLRYDAISKPRVFGSARGEPSVKRDGDAIELRTEVTFSQKPYVTFIVPMHCAGDAGQLSAAVRWETEGTDPDKPLTVELSAYE